MLKITHSYGFFSCCSVRLYSIINYLNTNKVLPIKVDSSSQFGLYKYNNNTDITFDFFEDYDNSDIQINYDKNFDIDINCFQFTNYKDIDYKFINSFISKYFSPSMLILNIYNKLLLKYNININNCIGLYYRGTDKFIETKLGTFESYYKKLNEIIDNNSNKNIQLIVQTDSTPFLNFMKKECNRQIIIINENSTSYKKKGIHNEKNGSENYVDMQYLFASFLIISKCKYIICSSGNCSVWMMFYRNNAYNVHQNLNCRWL